VFCIATPSAFLLAACPGNHPLGSVAGGATFNRKSEVPQSALFRFVSETVNCSSLPATPEGEEAGVIPSG
jgi:hypothetical protein